MVKKPTMLLTIAYLAFILTGLPTGLLGVAWPYMQESFHVSIESVGAVLAARTLGFLFCGFNSGRITSHFGVGPLLIASGAATVAGLVGYAVSPTWGALVISGFVLGAGTGGTGAALSTHVSTCHGARAMNWLHACFGLGAALGPVIMTTVVNMGWSWRFGYAFASVLQGLLVICFLLTSNLWESPQSKLRTDGDSPVTRASTIGILKLPIVWLGMILFFDCAGTETSVGQWSYSLLTKARSVVPSVAGLWVSAFWVSHTAGRLLFGLVVDHVGAVRILRAAMVGAVCGSVLIWLDPTDDLSFFGLVLLGASLAPVFPTLLFTTPARVGVAHTGHTIGFQIGAAGLGSAVLPALAGVLARYLGLESIGAFLVVASIIMFILHETLLARQR